MCNNDPIRRDQLFSQRKDAGICLLRRRIARALWDQGMTFAEIGKAINRDRSSVAAMLKRWD